MRVSGLVPTLQAACTTFCTNNEVKIAFKRRNITNGKEITIYFRQNRRMLAIFEFLGFFDAGKRVHNGLHVKWSKRAFKRGIISNGIKISLNFFQNRRMIAIYVCLGFLRRGKTRVLRSARIMH